jgi:hypothetical protein
MKREWTHRLSRWSLERLSERQEAGDRRLWDVDARFQGGSICGKRVRFNAFAKSDGVSGWAGLWMRVGKGSGATPQTLAFDNMQGRAIQGTTDWKNYAVVLDVPKDATGIFFGVLLNGSGSMWMSDVKVETVSSDVPTTDAMSGARPDKPTNLNFEQ